MSWWIWFIVVIIMLAMFGLGCVVTRAQFIHREEKETVIRMISNTRANAVLAVFFTVIALAVAIDTIYLQVRVNRYMHGQVDCNTVSTRANDKITRERMKVDQEAAEYDIAFQQYLVAHTDHMMTQNDPEYSRLQQALKDLASERLEMVKVYAENPLPNC